MRTDIQTDTDKIETQFYKLRIVITRQLSFTSRLITPEPELPTDPELGQAAQRRDKHDQPGGQPIGCCVRSS